MVTLSLIKEARIYSGEKTASSISGAECPNFILDSYMLKNEARTLLNTIYKNKLKMN